MALHFLGVVANLAAGGQRFKFLKAAKTLANGSEIGECSTQPTLGHVWHARFGAARLNATTRLTLGADKANIFAFSDQLGNESLCKKNAFDGFAHVNDMHLVLDSVNVRSHAWIPIASTLAKVGSSFYEFLRE